MTRVSYVARTTQCRAGLCRVGLGCDVARTLAVLYQRAVPLCPPRTRGSPPQVRNRLKIRAAINNAKLAAELEDSYPGGFAGWVWDTIGDMPTKERYIQRHLKSHMRSDFATKAKDR